MNLVPQELTSALFIDISIGHGPRLGSFYWIVNVHKSSTFIVPLTIVILRVFSSLSLVVPSLYELSCTLSYCCISLYPTRLFAVLLGLNWSLSAVKY